MSGTERVREERPEETSGTDRLAAACAAAPTALAAVGRGVTRPADVLTLQRAVGNAATRRILARQPDDKEYRVVPPGGPVSDVAAWVSKHSGARPGTDLVAVLTPSQLLIFSAGPSPSLIEKAKRGDAEHTDYFTGIWQFNQSTARAFRAVHGTNEYWDWWIAGHGPPETLADGTDQQKVKVLVPPDGGWLYVGIPGDGVTDDPVPINDDDVIEVTVTDDGSSWANREVKDAKKAIDAEKKEADDDPYSDTPPVPDKLVQWRRADGKWFLNVWVGKPSKGGEAMHVKPIELKKGEKTDELVARIHAAAQQIAAGLDPSSVELKGPGKKGGPKSAATTGPGEIEIPEGANVSPTGGRKATNPPFPARIVSHGSEGANGNGAYEVTVTGATVAFDMNLDFAAGTSGFWEEFGNYWQIIDYRWELIDVSSLDLDLVKGKASGPTEADLRARIASLQAMGKKDQADTLQKQLDAWHAEPDSGAARDIVRDLGNTWEDTKADVKDHAWTLLLGPLGASYFSMLAITDVVEAGGAVISAGISEAAAPMSERKIPFPTEGLFLLRCYAQPVITDDDIARIKGKGLTPIIRAPSVAYLPVRVAPISKRASEVNDAELAQIKSLEAAGETDKAKKAKAAMADNNVEAIDHSIEQANAELERIKQWHDLQGKVPLEQRDSALRVWEATLELAGVDLDSYEKDLHSAIDRMNSIKGRVSTWRVDRTDGQLFRPRITLVSALDGRPYPIMANLAQGKDSKEGSREWHLIDVSTDDTKHDYVGSGDTHSDAIAAAFQAFAENNQYGRGVIAVRLPPDQRFEAAVDHESIAVPGEMTSTPGDEERAIKRLKDLAVAAEIAGLFVTGPLGAGLMAVGGVAGGIVAIHNMKRRSESDRLKLVDFETAMDIVAVIGAVVGVGGLVTKGAGAATEVAEAATLARRGRKLLDGTIHVMGVGMLAGQVVIIPATVVKQLSDLDDAENKEQQAATEAGHPETVDHTKYRAKRLEAILGAMKSILVTARMVQMGADPSKGWDPFAEPVTQTKAPSAGMVAARDAAAGLTSDLVGRVTVEQDPTLGDSATVRVYYDMDPATRVITNVRMAVGKGAGATEVGLHVETARALLRYSGLSGRVLVLWNQLKRLIGSKEPPEGSRAWEARFELNKLPDVMANRAAQLANPKLTDARRAELVDELSGLEDQVDEHARTVADMNIDQGRGYIAAELPKKGGSKTKKPASSTDDPTGPTGPKPKTGPVKPTGPPPVPVAPPMPKPPQVDAGVSDARTAGTGGIEHISQITNRLNEVEVTIKGRLLEGMDRKNDAPNYNSDSIWGRLRKLHPELKLEEWEAAHLWGPGFGDEAAAGMMLAPEDVNQVWQNRGIESFLRELRDLATSQGWEIHVKATARSQARDFAGGFGDSLMQSVQYDFSVSKPGQTPEPYGQVSFSVGLPPGGVVSDPSVIFFKR